MLTELSLNKAKIDLKHFDHLGSMNFLLNRYYRFKKKKKMNIHYKFKIYDIPSKLCCYSPLNNRLSLYYSIFILTFCILVEPGLTHNLKRTTVKFNNGIIQ